MEPNDPNEDSGWGQAPLARDGSRAETDTRSIVERGDVLNEDKCEDN